MAAVGVAAAIGGVALLVVPRSHDKPVAAPQAALAAPAPLPVAPPPPSAPVAKTVTLRFEADPSGAHVFAMKDGKKDGKDLGESPVELQVPKGGQPAAYLFRLAGYREVALSAKPNADRTLHVSLEKLPPPAPTASETKHRASAHHGGSKHAKTPVDEDGLATPSF